jgi:hypothetical protein
MTCEEFVAKLTELLNHAPEGVWCQVVASGFVGDPDALLHVSFGMSWPDNAVVLRSTANRIDAQYVRPSGALKDTDREVTLALTAKELTAVLAVIELARAVDLGEAIAARAQLHLDGVALGAAELVQERRQRDPALQ